MRIFLSQRHIHKFGQKYGQKIRQKKLKKRSPAHHKSKWKVHIKTKNNYDTSLNTKKHAGLSTSKSITYTPTPKPVFTLRFEGLAE